MSTGELLGKPNKLRGVTCDGLASHQGGVEILLAASCYGNHDKLRPDEPVLAPRLHFYQYTLAWYSILEMNDNAYIQLFRQRLSPKSVKAYATMPIGIMGSKSLALLYWGSRCWERRQEKLSIHGFVLFLFTRWNTLSFNRATVKPPLPIITFDIVA